MNKSDLATHVAQQTGFSQAQARSAVDATFEAIRDALADDRAVTIQGFGTFTMRTRAARSGRNPRTGAPIDIPAGRTPQFKPSKRLKTNHV